MRTGAKHQRGTALVAVIWLIGILALASVATIRVVAFDLDVATSRIHGFRAEQLAEMGVAVGSNPAVEPDDPILRQYDEEIGEGFEVRIRSEGSKFNINAILLQDDRNLLKNMFIDWGLEIDEAGAVVDSMVDWIDGDDLAGRNGAEFEWYEAQGRTNQPFNRPFYNLDEMAMVRGMEKVAAWRPDWQDWFTIWSSGALDVNEADPEQIAVAAETDPLTADLIPETVRGPDGIRYTEDDQPFQSAEEALALLGVDGSLRPDILSRFTANETTTRIESTGISPGARRRIVLVVRNRQGQPAILERTEEVLP